MGVLDIDLCGPSIPRMLGVAGREVHQHDQVWIILFFNYYQCCGSGSRRAKMIQKSRKELEISCFEVLVVLLSES